MKRKDFLKKAFLSGVGTALIPKGVKAEKASDSTYDKLMNQVGFNHLPNQELKEMNTVLHKANTRGIANHGWLNSHHSFRFANYYNPDRMHFGVLRVLNDDVVAPGRGFGTHPHDNMEIISSPLEGDLEHKDSMGNTAIIKQGDVQVMSAGKGIYHSEYNKNAERDVKFLQIWVFPNRKNVTPRYDQISIKEISKPNQFNQILSPSEHDEGVWIHQNAWLMLGEFNKDTELDYEVKSKENGVYAFLLEGEAKIESQALAKRDGFGIWNTERVRIKPAKGARILLMDVPMTIG